MMHEFSVMTQIVDSILEEARKHDARKIEEVDLEVGEFTMLGEEQMRFAYEVLSKKTILDGARLNFITIKGSIKCPKCGYGGDVPLLDGLPHGPTPVLECPKCQSPAQITEGRDCVVRNIRMVVPDV